MYKCKFYFLSIKFYNRGNSDASRRSELAKRESVNNYI